MELLCFTPISGKMKIGIYRFRVEDDDQQYGLLCVRIGSWRLFTYLDSRTPCWFVIQSTFVRDNFNHILALFYEDSSGTS